MPVVKMDAKGRIQLPHQVREHWGLKPKQPLVVEIHQKTVTLRKVGTSDPATDPLLRDIMLRPARSKVKVTRKLLRKIEGGMRMPSDHH